MSRELMLENIRRAQLEIERKKESVRQGKMRQHYHFMGETGWINDPNGLIWYKGRYHYFYQYNPYYGFWDRIHWGHAVSSDLIHWQYLPPALAPSEEYDDHIRGGCFSGSAVEKDGKLFLIYTGTANNGRGFEQTQCVAYSEDGVHFEKYEGNPVLLAPDGISKDSFRDPKVWKHGEWYYMVCGAGKGGRGLALLYRSADLFHWKSVSVLAESRGEWGFMWECPDFYRLGDKYVLTFSPMGAGDHTAVYLVGDFDYNTGRFVWDISGEIDWGCDYYAPQSFLTPDGRRVITAWANGWEWMPSWKDWGPTYQEGWCGFYSLPREVRLTEEGTLQFFPVRELQMLRKNQYLREEILVGEEEILLSAGDGVSFEMKFVIDLKETDAKKIELKLRCGEGRKTRCILNLEQGEMRIDRNDADGWSRGGSVSTLFLKGKKELDIHIYSDQSSLEIFADHYQNNHSNNIYASNKQNEIRIRSYGGSTRIYDYESYGIVECFC